LRDRGGPLAQAAEQLAHGLFAHAQALGDRPVRQPGLSQPRDQPQPGRLQPGAARGVAARAGQGSEPAGLDPALVAAQRAGRAPKGAGDVILIGPALLDQAHHGVRFGQPIVNGVLGEHDARHEDDAMRVVRPDQAAVVDHDHLLVAARAEEEIWLRWVSRHGGSFAARLDSKKRTGLGPHPRPRSGAE
jgi:hypothetical protein